MDRKLYFTLGEIAEATGGQIISGDAATVVTHVATDTRRLSENNALFVALRGEKYDGHNFLRQARDAGASAALVEDISKVPERFAAVQVADTVKALGDLARARRKRFHVLVIAITGSYGKTTTRALGSSSGQICLAIASLITTTGCLSSP